MTPHDILRAPHRHEVIPDGDTSLLLVEPLRFIAVRPSRQFSDGSFVPAHLSTSASAAA